MMNQGGGGGMMNNQGGGGGGVGSIGNDSKPERRLSAASSVSGNFSQGKPGKGNEEKTDDEKAAWLKKLKDDIAAREREAAELEASLASKRKTEDNGDDQPEMKKVRAEE